MEETYTFSRALHMMRHGGKKMRCIMWKIVGIMWIENDDIYFLWDGEIRKNTYRFVAEEIMGSWVEVK